MLFGTDFGPGSMTISGYPRIVKLWKRGEPLSRARTDLRGQARAMSAPARWCSTRPPAAIALVQRDVSFFTAEYYQLTPDGATRQLPLPLGADLKGAQDANLIFTLREDWTARGRQRALRARRR